jgi:uncharacterized protein with PIN domain
MLGKLARWLLILGYDTAWARGADPGDLFLLERARREDRILLTRDARIPEVKGLRKIVLRSQRFEEQLRQVLAALSLKPDPARLFQRCTLCNVAIEAVAREAVLAELPEKVRSMDTDFFRCPSCRRLYWAGTHVENTLAKLKEAGII